MENTMLLFMVFDWDLVKKDDFAGMCTVPCRDIPRLQGTGAEQQRAMVLEILYSSAICIVLYKLIAYR